MSKNACVGSGHLAHVAKLLETTQSTVCGMEKRRIKPSYKKLMKILAVCDMDRTKDKAEQLFTAADENNLSPK